MRVQLGSSLPVTIVCLATGTLPAADDAFLSKWKVIPAKSVLTDEMKVTSLGGNKYTFDFGGGPPETIVADGTDQPGNAGTTMSTTIVSPNEWRGVRKKDGKVQIRGIWTLSEDGNTLHDDFTYFPDKGEPTHLVYEYERRGAGLGFAGDWVSTSGKVDSGIELEIQPYGSGGLSFSSPGLGLAVKVKFDGNDSPSASPDAPPVSTFSGRRVSQHCLVLTNKSQTIQYEISADLKTLTMSARQAGDDKPKNILVFEASPSAADPFVGKWKINPAKTKLTDEMKVDAVGENKYAITFGPGAVDTIAADGTDQPALQGTTLSVTVEGPNNWKVIRKKEGRTLLIANWTLSADGKTLDDDYTGYQADGSTMKLHYVYQRAAGSSGFPGTWDSARVDLDATIELEVQPYEGDGLSFNGGGFGMTRKIKFDGKDYRRVNQRRLEITNTSNGKIASVRQIELSEDLKTLTVSIYQASDRKPKNILVFDREL